MLNVNFEQESLQVICHPQYQKLVPKLLSFFDSYHLKNHFLLFSSGTTGGALKGYALSRDALFANAHAVNEHFHMTKDDVWGLSLPIYHIGGLSVLARAHLLKNQVVDLRQWDPESWLQKIESVTITTIVPTQLFDLVKRGLKAPPHLRYLIVGGDFLSSELKSSAIKLGWPVIRTFGMSEVCSQLASARTPASDELEILPIHQVKIHHDTLLVKSSALFTLEFSMGDEIKVTMAQDLCEDGFYQTKDRASLSGNILHPEGRLGDEFKISGHLINLNQLRDALSTHLLKKNLFNQMEFTIEHDERKGKKLILLSLPSAAGKINAQEISKLISPVKLDEMRIVDNFERTDLGKLKRKN